MGFSFRLPILEETLRQLTQNGTGYIALQP
jgi:hypothetical protein